MPTIESQHAAEVRGGDRFEFGANWRRFLATLTEDRIELAVASLRSMLGRDTLQGLTFLDAGSGSGLFSLAAYRLGARVRSFDFDPQSTACTEELRRRYASGDSRWTVGMGSVLDTAFVDSLGKFDVVYSWGVLHHTGNQALALSNIERAAPVGGMLFIALYNDQGWISSYWSFVKRLYNRRPALKPLVIAFHIPYLLVGRFVARALTGRLREARGMSLWYDMIDWLGGWPFEVSRPVDIVQLHETRGFEAIKVVDVGNRPGCNEFVFVRKRVA